MHGVMCEVSVCALSLWLVNFWWVEIVRKTTFHILYPGKCTSVQSRTPTSFLHISAQF